MSTEPSYWGGSTVHGGRVRKLNATNFEQLVSRYLNVPVQNQMTRAEFLALPVKEQDKAKDGHYITACQFAFESEGHRSDADAISIHLVFLDLDEGPFIKDMAEFPETISEALYPYNHAVWHTAKSQPDSPRLKIMVDVSPCHPSELKRILRFVATRLGLPSNFKGVVESGITSQPQYRPCQWRGSEFNAVITSRTDGLPIHLSDLPEMEPDEEEMISGRTYACDPSDGGDEFYGLAFLPVQGLAVDDIREALNTIDPDVTRPVWLKIAAALRHQFTDEVEAQAAFDAFEEWSAKGTKFAGRKDVWSLWRSLKPYSKGRAPVTVRTLYHFAQENGWSNTKVAAKLSQTIEEWLDETTDLDTLLQDGAKKIASLPFTNEVVEESLVNKLRKRISALGETIDKATLKKEIARVRRDDKRAKAEIKNSNLPGWLRPIVYVATSDTFHNLGNGVDLKPAAFDRFFAKEMMPKEGETPPTGVPVMQPGPYALNIMKILRVEETIYDPTKKEDEKIFPCSETGKILLNTYNHNSLPVPDPEHKDRAEKLIRQTIAPLVKEPHLRETLLDYLALQVQAPGVKIPWSFLIQSGPGAGKGTLGEIMEAVLGPVNVKIISPIQMAANFNEWAVGSAFGIFNEIHIPGERRDQVMNAIKGCISDPTISLNLKHRDGECRAKNFTNYLGFSNYKDAAHIAAEDRRWGIIFAPMQTRDQALTLQATGHFDHIRWLITPEGASALRYYFLKRIISPEFPFTGHAPNTTYRSEVVAQSKNTLQIEIEDAIEDGEYPLIGPLVIHEAALKEVVCRNTREHGLVPRYLSQMGYERDSTKRIMCNGMRGIIWVHTENWKGENAEKYLKDRLKGMPELDEEIYFE